MAPQLGRDTVREPPLNGEGNKGTRIEQPATFLAGDGGNGLLVDRVVHGFQREAGQVLIGAETSQRNYVGFEITQSYKKGNGLLGIYVHNVKDVYSRTDMKGANPFANWQVPINGRTTSFTEIYPTYDWVNDNGRANLGDWIEAAAKKAGR